MEDTSILVWGTFFGGIGIGFFIYGKKQKNRVSLLTGIALFLIPYLVTDSKWLILASMVMIALPFLLRRSRR